MKNFFAPDKNESFDKLINKLGDNNKITSEILKIVANTKTKIILDEELNTSYYVFLNDTIYIADNLKNQSYYRVCLLSHECIHSIQNKILQLLNFILSNIELILFGICFILNVFFEYKFILALNLVYFGINILSIVIRLILEMDAIKRSVWLSNEYLKNKIETKDLNLIINQYKKELKRLYPFFIINLFCGRISRFLLIFIVFYCKFYKNII